MDFGHELITAVHTPIAWSDRRPSDEEFRQSFATTKLSATKILDFFQQRMHITTRLVLLNSEGYWSGRASLVLGNVMQTRLLRSCYCWVHVSVLRPCFLL